jgi:hypothetical protein
MNYFAHGRHYVADPYLLAGTAVPDWLNVVDRRIRARQKAALPLTRDDDPCVAAVARGVVQHHRDDDWFHQSRAFAELSWGFTRRVRDELPGDDGLRPSFLGHILVELLLDAVLIEEDPMRLDAYYQAMDRLDPTAVQMAVNRITQRPTDQLGRMIELFREVRFLPDYTDDDKLFFRLGQIMRRVRLSPLPNRIRAVFPWARDQVRQRRGELLQNERTRDAHHEPGH